MKYPQLHPDIFAPLHARFSFTVDAAAEHDNALLERYWTPEDDGLAQPWAGERVWCHPPYDDIGPWTSKARKREAVLAVLLLPVRDEAWCHELLADVVSRWSSAPVVEPIHVSLVHEDMEELIPSYSSFLAVWR